MSAVKVQQISEYLQDLPQTQKESEEIQKTIREVREKRQISNKFHGRIKTIHVQDDVLYAQVGKKQVVVLEDNIGKGLTRHFHLGQMNGHEQPEKLMQ